jgi:hypothetical protein
LIEFYDENELKEGEIQIFILTLRLNDNFDKSRLGVTTVDPFGGELNELILGRLDKDKRGRSGI